MYLIAAVQDPNEWKIILGKIVALYKGFLKILPQLLIATGVLFLTWAAVWVAQKILGTLLQRTKLRNTFQSLVLQLTSVVFWIAGLMTAAVILFPSITPGRLIAGLGIGSVAVGFAFKDIFENFFAGVLILWRFPFTTNDVIQCNDLFGHVEKVTVRNTLLRQPDGQLVVVPNGTLFKNSVYVVTDQAERRTEAVVGIGYDEDIEEARSTIQKALDSCESVRSHRGTEIRIDALDSSSVNFKILWWSGSTPKQVRASRDEVITRIKKALDEANISIPFPHRTLVWNEPLQHDQISS
ncbi:MAG: mechanosensitive ion channel family protein [Deltaproteobacteria bacterium]|nr:MAG: mechanosensitive ion channel family protein [Deltaproteobacteria bacterium]